MTHISYSSPSSSLDSKKPNRNKRCGHWSLEGHFPGRTHYARLRCKAWKCPRCGPRKLKQVRRGFLEAATQKKLRRFLTLTLNPRYCAPEDSLSYVKRCWAKFRIYLKRRYHSSISFIELVEFHRSGYAHLHVLVDRYIEQQWIVDAWQAVGGGKIVDIRYVDIHRIAPYMAKYLTKDLLLAPFKPRQRRYSTSRDITLLPKTPSEIRWQRLKAPLEFLFTLRRGKLIEACLDQQGVLQWYELSTARTG